MQRPQSSTYKDDLDSNLCALKTPIFRNFFHNYSTGNFSRKWKKHVFFTTAAPPTGDLWKIQSPTFVGHIFLSQKRALPGKLNYGIFLQSAKSEQFSPDKSPLADDFENAL